jgi:hypothetical protein
MLMFAALSPYVFLPSRPSITVHPPVLPMTQNLSAARLGNVNLVRMLLYVAIFLTAEVKMICLLFPS